MLSRKVTKIVSMDVFVYQQMYVDKEGGGARDGREGYAGTLCTL
jgi:hypothetical protein